MQIRKETCLMIGIVGIIASICAFLFTQDLRSEAIQLRQWKSSYENGYCPTCGAKLAEQENNK